MEGLRVQPGHGKHLAAVPLQPPSSVLAGYVRNFLALSVTTLEKTAELVSKDTAFVKHLQESMLPKTTKMH